MVGGPVLPRVPAGWAKAKRCDTVKQMGKGDTGMKRFLIVAISSLALTGCLKDFRNDPKEQHVVYKDKPNGRGEATAISCYRPPTSTNRFSELECRRNSEWAEIAVRDNRNAGPLDIGNRAGGAAVSVIPGR
jgi:hypothetical protein